MKLLNIVAGLSGLAGAAPSPRVLSNNPADEARIPTSYESAVMGRRILALSKLATLSTVFPNSPSHGSGQYGDSETLETRPDGLGGVPIGLMDYVADCEDDGNPTILAVKIGTSFKNVRAGSNMTISMRWIPPYPPSKRISLLRRVSAYVNFFPHWRHNGHVEIPDTVPYSAVNLPRFAMLGHLEEIGPDASAAKGLAACYKKKHQDARHWLPGNRIHETAWTRFVVTNVYWIGGFGDRAYIGWIPVEEWKKVTRHEWKSIQLPGEREGWSEDSLVQGEL